MAGRFTIAVDWTSSKVTSPMNTWLTRRVRAGGFARFRAHGVELYVDHSGLVELREHDELGRVLYRSTPERGDQLRRIGQWVTTNLGLSDSLSAAQADEVIRVLGNSSVPEALDVLGSVVRLHARQDR